MSKRRTHHLEFKARVATEPIRGRKSIEAIAAGHAMDALDSAHRRVRSDPGELSGRCGAASIDALLPADTGAGIDAANHGQIDVLYLEGSLQR